VSSKRSFGPRIKEFSVKGYISSLGVQIENTRHATTYAYSELQLFKKLYIILAKEYGVKTEDIRPPLSICLAVKEIAPKKLHPSSQQSNLQLPLKV
jgi:hypothetical protein